MTKPLDPNRLVHELRRRANLPKDVPDRAFLIAIRWLLNQAADAIEDRTYEYGIFRESSTPAMSGEQRYTRIVNVSFSSLEEAQASARRVPALRGVPVIIRRRTVTEWENAE